MKLCTDCKYHMPDMDFSNQDLRDKFAMCGHKKYIDPSTGKSRAFCRIERRGYLWFIGWLFNIECGKSGRWFEPKGEGP